MTSVWWVAPGTSKTITVQEWAANGITAPHDTVWSPDNGWSIPESALTEAQITALSGDKDYRVGAPDGPKQWPAGPPLAQQEYPELSARQYLLKIIEIIANFDPGPGGGGIDSTDDVPEGATNLYYTAGRADARADLRITAANLVAKALTSTAGMGFVIDEDSFASDLDTKVPTQQSVKAYVTAKFAALIAAAPAELDTWLELVAAIQSDQGAISGIMTSLSGKQNLDATLTALAAITTAADKLIYATGSDVFATTTLTSFMRTLLDDVDAATARGTLGLGSLSTVTPTGTANSTTVLYGDGVYRAPASGANNYLVWTGTAWPARPSNGLPTLWVGGDAPDDAPPEFAAGDTWLEATGGVDLGTILEAFQLIAGTANTIPYLSGLNTFGNLGLKTVMSATPLDTNVLTEKAVKDYADKVPVSSIQTGAYSFVATDKSTCVEYNNTTAATFTLGSSILAPGEFIEVRAINTGILTIAGTGVVAPGSRLKLSGQWASATITCRASGSYVVTGDCTT